MRSAMAVLVVTVLCGSAMGKDEWSIDQPRNKIPNKAISGRIFGKPFTLGSADMNQHALTLKSKAKSGMWAESEIIIFVSTKDGKKEWTVTPNSEGMVPHVHMKFAKPGKTFPGTLMYTGEYSMRLVLTNVTKTQVKGRIHISLPDYKKSYLIGSFVARRQ